MHCSTLFFPAGPGAPRQLLPQRDCVHVYINIEKSEIVAGRCAKSTLSHYPPHPNRLPKADVRLWNVRKECLRSKAQDKPVFLSANTRIECLLVQNRFWTRSINCASVLEFDRVETILFCRRSSSELGTEYVHASIIGRIERSGVVMYF